MIVSALSLALLSMVLETEAAALRSRDSGFSISWDGAPGFQLNINSSIVYQLNAPSTVQNVGIILCQTDPGATGSITAANSWRVLNVMTNGCFAVNGAGCSPQNTVSGDANKQVTLDLGFSGATTLPASALTNFFFCFSGDANGGAICQGYSPVFDIGTGAVGTTNYAVATPTSAITVTATRASLGLLQGPSTTILPTTIPTTGAVTAASVSIPTSISLPTTTSYATVSQTPSLTVYITPTATDGADSTSAAITSSSSHKSFPIGAIVGVALGGLVVIIAILLLALFFLRRKHAQKKNAPSPPPEQVMLTRDMHNDSFSTPPTQHTNEKYGAKISVAAGGMLGASDATFAQSNSSLPIQRHSALPLLPYESPPSIPYSGIAARPPSPGARRLPVPGQATTLSSPLASPTHQPATLNPNHTPTPTPSPPPPYAHPPISHPQPSPIPLPTTLVPLSRNLSSATSNSATSPGDAFSETYHDMPIFGDARHSPQVFEGRTITPVPSVSQTRHTFLSEDEVMSEEELEEERRIDLAIAEAEDRRRAGAGSGMI